MNKKKLASIAAIVVLVVGMLFVYNNFKEKPVEGSKAITIEVVNSAQESKRYELKTDVEYLAEAMEEVEELELVTVDGPYGLVIEEVNGERAVYEEDNAYWSIMVNGEYGNYGENYGRRGRDMKYRGDDSLDRMSGEYGRYMESRQRYGAGSQESDKSFHYMVKALEDFVMVLKEEAETPQQKQQLMEALQNSMR